MKSDDVWPPGFVPQLIFTSTERKKAAAATKAREKRAAEGVQPWGTNTVPRKEPA